MMIFGSGDADEQKITQFNTFIFGLLLIVLTSFYIKYIDKFIFQICGFPGICGCWCAINYMYGYQKLLWHLMMQNNVFWFCKIHQKTKEKNMVNQYLNEHGNLDRFFTPKQLAAYLGSSVSALSQYRAQGIGPAYYKIGRAVRYRLSEVNEWLEQQKNCKK